MAARALAIALLAAAAGGAAAQDDAGRAFEVVCEGADEALLAEIGAVVEPVWPRVTRRFGVELAAPQRPLKVHLYLTLDGYLAADRELTGGRFQPNQAMSHWRSRSAHVALQPPRPVAWLRQHGLPLQTEAMLVWEACHVARFELCPNFRRHPGWFHDGLAAAVAEEVLRERHGDLGAQPFFTQRWWRVRRLAADEALPRVRALLGDETGDLDMRDRYAARVVFFDVAQQLRPKELARLARAVRDTADDGGYAKALRAAAVRELGDLDGPFARRVAARRPAWDEAIRSLWIRGDEWHQIAFPDANAVAWRADPVRTEGGAFTVEGHALVHDGRSRQLNLLFAGTDDGFYSLALVAGQGFTLFHHRTRGNQWRVLGSGTCDGFRPGVEAPFALRVRGRQVEVELLGETTQLQLPKDLPEAVRWGVGAQAATRGARYGTSGVWRGVRARGGAR